MADRGVAVGLLRIDEVGRTAQGHRRVQSLRCLHKLAAGSTVAIPAERTPLSALLVDELVTRASDLSGVINLVNCYFFPGGSGHPAPSPRTAVCIDHFKTLRRIRAVGLGLRVRAAGTETYLQT